jgi:hypothetical protein
LNRSILSVRIALTVVKLPMEILHSHAFDDTRLFNTFLLEFRTRQMISVLSG